MRARPHLRQPRLLTEQSADEVPVRVDLDLEPCLGHPATDEPVRLILLG